MASVVQQRRPLILLHKCSECATFALAPMPILEQKKMDIDRIRLRFSQALGLNTTKTVSTILKPDEGDDDSAYGSNSGQSSPDESPMSRSDSPSPVGARKPESSIKNEESTLSLNRLQNPFRYRSMSESGSPLKGILKQRPNVMRSLSQCDEESPVFDVDRRRSESPILSSIHSSNDDVLGRSISDSGDDDDGQPRDRSQSSSSKKTVRFNDRVQENVFRPNSSILGQRKKNQKKQQRKRRRTNSGDSQTGGSEYDTDHDDHDGDHCQDVDMQEIDRSDQESIIIDHHDQKVICSGDQSKSVVQPAAILQSVATIPENSETTDSEKRNRKANRKKNQRQSAAVLSDKRYDGFVLAGKKSRNHRRNSSGDSGLGDDEGDFEAVDTTPVSKSAKNRRRRTVSCSDPKVDDE